ncbi:uncharacterized protein Bfra_002455 [Botrytis fragariae]|uniref:Uncharacterized protein n=1 Tax=Botrytis fragariae TaxID=1964551 RepID=A0A8H6AYD6_9HELO|nr:uncharacterized protein Bfra_002455 [Botrytis fragariae]KAF5876056.1 hypothetical protein Bfra_002455 [Botrytis fragariae]
MLPVRIPNSGGCDCDIRVTSYILPSMIALCEKGWLETSINASANLLGWYICRHHFNTSYCFFLEHKNSENRQ